MASLGFAVALGPATFALALVGLACAWGYNLWLKNTAASGLAAGERRATLAGTALAAALGWRRCSLVPVAA